MSKPHPKLEDLPETFAVFPLTGALLMPGGKLPLNVFEKRYLAMTEDALASGRMFGMIQPDPQRPGTPDRPGLYRIGCLGRLSSFSETEDGRYLITLTGLIRFTVISEIEGRRGYRRVQAEFERFAADLEPKEGDLSGFDRERLLAALRTYFTKRGFDANWDAIGGMSDDALVVTLSMVCPFDAASKQALLEAPTPIERAQALLTVLQIAAHEPGDDEARPGRSRAS
jgi:Lon protease-like protein